MTGVVAVLWLVAGTAGGEPVPADESGQRWLGFGPEAGLFGIGGAIHAGGLTYGGYLGGTLAPVLVVQSSPSSQSPAINLFATGDLRADVYAYAWRTERGRFGPLAGASYNTLLGVGFNLGGGGTVKLGRTVDLSIRVLFSVYPDASSRLRGHINEADGAPTTPWLQGGAAIGLLFYP